VVIGIGSFKSKRTSITSNIMCDKHNVVQSHYLIYNIIFALITCVIVIIQTDILLKVALNTKHYKPNHIDVLCH
jgi:uncharacterized membrane protein